MKRILVVVLVCIGFCGYAGGQQNAGDQPATKEDIQRYLDVMHSKEMMTQIVDAMVKPMHQLIHEQYMKDKDKLPPDFEARMNKMIDDELKSFPWSDFLDAMIPVYQKHFTKKDVDAFVAFYSTPTGQKLIKELPQITTESMQAMMPLLQKQMDSMQKRVQDEVAEMIKQSAPQSKGSGAQDKN